MNINIKFGIIKFTADYNSGTILDRTSWSVLRIPLCNSKDKKNPLPCYNMLLLSQFKKVSCSIGVLNLGERLHGEALVNFRESAVSNENIHEFVVSQTKKGCGKFKSLLYKFCKQFSTLADIISK